VRVKRNSKATAAIIYFRCQFRSRDLLPVVAVYIVPNFADVTHQAAELLHFVEKFNMAVAAIVDLLELKYDGTAVSGTPFSVAIPNFMRIYAIATEL